MISINKICKSFGGNKSWMSGKKSPVVVANQNIDLTCSPGEIHGLLGVNGAGKSTALKILCGLQRPDSGDVLVNGIDVQKNREDAQKQMGIFLSSEGLYPKLTAKENIELFAAMHGVKDASSAADKIIQKLEMDLISSRLVEGFSTGQKMKVALGRALVHQPKYVILDEPTRGLDVLSIRLLRRYLIQLKENGCCILFSSHVMQEIEKLCDKVTVIHDGKVCYSGTVETMRVEHSFNSSALGDAKEHVFDIEDRFIQLVGA